MIVCLIALIGCERNASSTENTKSEKPVIVYYTFRYSRDLEGPPEQLNAAVWRDGRIVWREDDNLLQSRIEVKQIDALLQRLNDEGAFGDGSTYEGHFGPDSSFRVLEVNLPDRQLKLASWHEGRETIPNLVATAEGIVPLDGRDRDAVLAAQPPEYQRFRRIWSEIRSTLDSWKPADGEPFNGTVPVDFAD